MRTGIFAIVVLNVLHALVCLPVGSRAFVGTRQNVKLQQNSKSRRLEFLETSASSVTRTSKCVQGNRVNGDTGDSINENVAFSMLSTDRDNKPNQGNFFYNDEVISHLYGYMYLVGFFAAQDGLFLGNFLVLSSVTAWATQKSLLPCNPRIPAITAAMTLASTFFFRYVIGFEPPLGDILENYQGPAESSALFELIICALNIGWGFFGTWQTKEQVNGATYGF